MPNAEITTEDGLHIKIEGTTEEVAALIDCVKSRIHQSPPTYNEEKPKKIKTAKKTLSDIVLDLKYEGFFDTPKTASKVKDVLEQKGHFFRFETVSTTLIRLLKQNNLGRVKETGKWAYVKR